MNAVVDLSRPAFDRTSGNTNAWRFALPSAACLSIITGLTISAHAQSPGPKPVRDAWEGATAYCTADGNKCADLAQQAGFASRLLLKWVEETDKDIPDTNNAGRPILTERSFQTEREPRRVIADRFDRLDDSAQVSVRFLDDISERMSGRRGTLIRTLKALSQSIEDHVTILKQINSSSEEVLTGGLSSLDTLPDRSFTDAAMLQTISEIDTLLERAEDIGDTLRSSLRASQGALETLRNRLADKTQQTAAYIETVDWSDRQYSVDLNVLLALQKLTTAAHILYNIDLTRFAFESNDFPKFRYQSTLDTLTGAFQALEKNADWQAQARAVNAAHAVLTQSVNALLIHHGYDAFEDDLGKDGKETKSARDLKTCLTDKARKFTAYLDSRLTARSAPGLFSIDFDPERSRVRLDNKFDPKCVPAESLKKFKISFPAQMTGGMLGLNLYLSVTVGQINWYAAQSGLLMQLETFSAKALAHIDALKEALEREPDDIARRGERLACAVDRRMNVRETGSVVFNAEVEPDGSVRTVVFPEPIPDSFDRDQLTRRIKSVLRCQEYKGRTIDGAAVLTWSTIQLEIQ